jgi:hypothetical protein
MAEKNYLVDLNLNKNELLNARLQNLDSLPKLSDPTGTDLDYIGLIACLANGDPYILKNVSGTATWKPLGEGGTSGGGGIFVMGVSPNVTGESASSSKSNSDGEDITEIIVTNKSLKFSLLALTGSKNLKPAIYYTLGTDTTQHEITSTSLVKQTDRPVYLVTNYAIDVTGHSYITFIHEDGATKRLDITTDSLPIISAVFSGGYPTFTEDGTVYSQTELAFNNKVQLTINSDKPIWKINVYAEGGLASAQYAFTDNLYSKTINVYSNYTGTIAQNLGAVVTVTTSEGSKSTSAKYYTFDHGSTNGINYMRFNNLTPTFGQTAVGYNSGYSAINTTNNTTAIATIPITNETSLGSYLINYSTNSNNPLLIPNPTEYASSKQVSTSWAGYDILTSNYTLYIRKLSNGTTASTSINVGIASIAPTITITTLETRLISSAAGYNHTITASSDQQLNSLSLSPGSGGGNWLSSSSFSSSNKKTWTNTLVVIDAMTKTSYNWTGLVATNIAGLQTNVIYSGSQYTLGGFTERTVTMAGSARTVSVPGIAVTQSGYDAGKCIISWKGTPISSTLQPSGPRFAAGTPLSPTQPINNAWCIDATSNTPRTTEIRFLNSGEALSSETTVTIKEIA